MNIKTRKKNMSTKNNGGPAFPLNSYVIDDIAGMGRDEELHIDPLLHQPGMTLRDYFAACALQGIIAAQAGEKHFDALVTQAASRSMSLPHLMSGMAYESADAMLIEREK